MNEEQFEALVKLVPLKTEAIRRGCNLVLVHGVPTPEAAKQVNMAYRALWNSIKRCREKMELARIVASRAQLIKRL